MPDVADRLSDQDDAETARMSNVCRNLNQIFDSLVRAFESRINKYNERHPSGGFPFPNAITWNRELIWDKETRSILREMEFKLKKNTVPLASLASNLPSNSGEMQVTLNTIAGSLNGTITLDIVNDVPTYKLDGTVYSADGLADVLLEPVLSSTGAFGVGRKYGFV